MKKIFLLLALAVTVFPLDLHAATRKVYFSVVGRNSATEGFANDERSRCIISITNSSSQPQNYDLDMTGSGTSLNGGAQSPAVFVGASGVTLNGGLSRTHSFEFEAFTASTAGYQDVTCAGAITVRDTGPNPGFITANGSLITFYESGAQHTLTATGADQTHGQQAIFTQIPIPINGGKPF